MGLYNMIFIITSHVTDLLFSFLLPHFFSSIYAQPGSVSANSTVAIPGASRGSDHLCAMAPSLCQGRRAVPCAVQYYISSHCLGCLTSPGLTTLFHPKADRVHSRQPMVKPRIHVCGYWHRRARPGFPSPPAALCRDTGSFEGQDLFLL